ncbi:rhamnosyltransferase [Bombiscardovia apis]|uniref:Rhamnosyltransferase n=1 Tax=Bombiscardovia apis TaxID=2932182 RepID=A0ABM8BEP4_9BIFI|nr:glycosyltransferase family 2 protein [Bombiscardovia apis]BDR55411.1 rhamnosyltransferase [Bombiscardovia apis]
MTVSVIIPTLNAGEQITELLETLSAQDLRPDEILVVDSQSDDDTVKRVSAFENVKLISIERSTFNHGGTRDMAFKQAHGDYVLFLTQDALPKNRSYIRNLLAPFSNPKVGMASGRQIARADARPFEKLVRQFNYPDQSFTRSKADLPKLGIKTFFASDVCSAYRTTSYMAVGGFGKAVDTNEDMLIAAKMINSGYDIAYVADAEVIHSHNLSFKQQYKRNYAVGKFMETHKTAFLGADKGLNNEGIQLVKYVMKNLLRERHYLSAYSFSLDCVARIAGNKAGVRSAKRL